MRMSLRLIFSLVVGVTLLSFLFAVFRVRAEKRGQKRELENRAAIVGDNLEAKVDPLLNPRLHKRFQAAVTNIGNSEHLRGIAIFDRSGTSLAATPGLEDYWRAMLPQAIQVMTAKMRYASFATLDGKLTHIYILPLQEESEVEGALAVFHDASFIQAQTSRLWWDTFLNVLAQAVFIALVTLLIIRWSILGPIARATKWVREIRAGKRGGQPELEGEDFFKPLAQEVTHLAKSLEAGARRGRGGSAASRDRRITVDAGTPAPACAQQAGRPAVLRGLQSRTLHAHLPGEKRGSHRPGQRLGYGH